MKALMTRAIAALMSAFIPRWPGPYLHPGIAAYRMPRASRNGGRRSGVPAARRAARKRRNGRRRHG
ncbi:MAG: hypothetical protein II007_04525 [Gammaproteobacteria bacterium]|nr:hypothetical protein [Gammaproteobacteria bacterium]